jgi:uncharacterized protein
MARFHDRFPLGNTLIGVIHLPPLPGYLSSPGLAAVIEHALADLEAFERGGLDGVLVENEHDKPHRVEAARETIACMTAVTRELTRAARAVPIGIEILLNDPEASLAVAHAAGAAFIRTDYFVDEMKRPEHGPMRIAPDELIAYRSVIGADDVLLLADIQVKYAQMLVARPLAESARLAALHGADAVIVTGTRTGEPPTIAEIVSARSDGCPVLIGSGLDAHNAASLLPACEGAIVGTSLLTDGHADPERVAALRAAAPTPPT